MNIDNVWGNYALSEDESLTLRSKLEFRPALVQSEKRNEKIIETALKELVIGSVESMKKMKSTYLQLATASIATSKPILPTPTPKKKKWNEEPNLLLNQHIKQYNNNMVEYFGARVSIEWCEDPVNAFSV